MLATVGPIAGFFIPIHSHNLRYSSGCDIANLEEGIKGIITPATAAALSYMNASYLRGVMNEYVGTISKSMWLKYPREKYRDKYGIAVTNAAFSKKQKIHYLTTVTA
jgi:hypothetical protein